MKELYKELTGKNAIENNTLTKDYIAWLEKNAEQFLALPIAENEDVEFCNAECPYYSYKK